MRIESKGFGLFGVGGVFIELTDHAVIIATKSADFSSGGAVGVVLSAASATSTGHTIPYEAIASVNLSQGGWASKPFLQVVSVGERVVADEVAAMASPSCFVFKKTMLPDFQKMKTEIELRVARAKHATRNHGTASPADEIRKLAELLQAGHITQQEYDAKKQQILNL